LTRELFYIQEKRARSKMELRTPAVGDDERRRVNKQRAGVPVTRGENGGIEIINPPEDLKGV